VLSERCEQGWLGFFGQISFGDEWICCGG
jgi:hypothetical protein